MRKHVLLQNNGDLSEDRTPTSRTVVRWSTTRPPRLVKLANLHYISALFLRYQYIHMEMQRGTDGGRRKMNPVTYPILLFILATIINIWINKHDV